MYNCSHLFDDATFDTSWNDLLSYTECFGTTIDPLQVYASCLKVMCNREANGTDISQGTCRTLTRAADLCDVRVGRKLDGSYAWVDPYMSLTHLLDRHAPQCRTNA
ncbi:uncharacterized protein [Littorina saxatilis]|uniref:uncharacterized protein n=1 Tax=Littorina saxatilis TaxID=31220 RepID=UPI0038B45F5B